MGFVKEQAIVNNFVKLFTGFISEKSRNHIAQLLSLRKFVKKSFHCKITVRPEQNNIVPFSKTAFNKFAFVDNVDKVDKRLPFVDSSKTNI